MCCRRGVGAAGSGCSPRRSGAGGHSCPSGLELRPTSFHSRAGFSAGGLSGTGPETLPTVTAHTRPSSFPPCGLAQEGARLTPAHRSGPSTDTALLSWVTDVRWGRPSPRGRRRRASGRKDAPRAPSLRTCPICSPLPLRALQGRCASLHSLWACRGPIHPGLCPESPALLPLSGAPGAPLSLAPTRLGPRGSAAVCGFCGCDAPAPRLLQGQSPLGCPVTSMINSGLPVNIAGFADAQLLGHAGCHGLTGASEQSPAGRKPRRRQRGRKRLRAQGGGRGVSTGVLRAVESVYKDLVVRSSELRERETARAEGDREPHLVLARRC